MNIVRFNILSLIIIVITNSCSIHEFTQPEYQSFIEKANKSIDTCRKGTIIIYGKPGMIISVEQTKHEFLFGNCFRSMPFEKSDWSESNKRAYLDTLSSYFNAITPEYSFQWHMLQPEKDGVNNFNVLDSIVDWNNKHGYPVTGHALLWGKRLFIQGWVRKLPDSLLKQYMKKHVQEMVTRYNGKIAEYHICNESVHGKYYENKFGFGIYKEISDWIREVDTITPVGVNEYNVLTGRILSKYLYHIRKLTETGVALKLIGCQGHLHTGYFQPEVLKASLDSLSQFNIPIKITEFVFPGQFYGLPSKRLNEKQEILKAQNIELYYRICFAHPSVTGIYQWGLWEKSTWLKYGALWKEDWTPTPSAEMYKKLVFNEWWTTWKGSIDSTGICNLPAFFGDYKISFNDKIINLKLSKKDKIKKVKL
jgi:GH35 family endo-1,4-beta-xylanase